MRRSCANHNNNFTVEQNACIYSVYFVIPSKNGRTDRLHSFLTQTRWIRAQVFSAPSYRSNK